MFITPVEKVLTTILLFTVAFAARSQGSVNIDSQLPGTYEYLNVLELLSFPFDTSLNFICPKTLDISATQFSRSFDLKISNASESASGFECYVKDNEIVRAFLQRVESEETGNGSSHTTGAATLLHLENNYPTFLGNFSDHPLICSFLDASIQPTIVTVRDTGYLFTILNHYKSTQIPFGRPLNVLSWDLFQKATEMYTVSLTIVPDRLGCTFIGRKDKEALLALKNDILNPSPSPTETPAASMSEAPTATPSVSGSSSPRASPTESKTNATCFPANAKVKLSTGDYVTMENLQVGSLVLDSADTFSKVILFSHSDSQVLYRFVHIHAEDTEIILSPSHFVYINNRLVAAEDVQVGDSLINIIGNGSGLSKPSRVKFVEKRTLQGLYNPHTTSGNIVVFSKGYNGVLASTYTKAVEPRFAHMLLWPLRQLAERTGKTFGLFSIPFAKGNQFWPHHFQKARTLKESIYQTNHLM